MFLTLSSMLALSAVGGCASSGIAKCSGFKPISASRADTTDTKRQVLAHNSHGVAIKCW